MQLGHCILLRMLWTDSYVGAFLYTVYAVESQAQYAACCLALSWLACSQLSTAAIDCSGLQCSVQHSY